MLENPRHRDYFTASDKRPVASKENCRAATERTEHLFDLGVGAAETQGQYYKKNNSYILEYITYKIKHTPILQNEVVKSFRITRFLLDLVQNPNSGHQSRYLLCNQRITAPMGNTPLAEPAEGKRVGLRSVALRI
jgi:hypothetical protein